MPSRTSSCEALERTRQRVAEQPPARHRFVIVVQQPHDGLHSIRPEYDNGRRRHGGRKAQVLGKFDQNLQRWLDHLGEGTQLQQWHDDRRAAVSLHVCQVWQPHRLLPAANLQSGACVAVESHA